MSDTLWANTSCISRAILPRSAARAWSARSSRSASARSARSRSDARRSRRAPTYAPTATISAVRTTPLTIDPGLTCPWEIASYVANPTAANVAVPTSQTSRARTAVVYSPATSAIGFSDRRYTAMPSNVTSTGHRRRPINTAVPSRPATTTNQRGDSVHRGELRIAATATRKLVPTTHESAISGPNRARAASTVVDIRFMEVRVGQRSRDHARRRSIPSPPHPRPSSGVGAVRRPMPHRTCLPHDGAMIDVQNLTKTYDSHPAVDDVSFRCDPGTVTGFLGPNGAGKSTTMRMLTGLTPPTAGTATIGGRSFADLPNPGRLVGVMLDASAQHPGRSGRETLRLSARLLDVPLSATDDLLEQVGLTDAARRKVATYSLGMRQRLGIANALLGDPAVLILDEPANGMDPDGIRWMRHLLQAFAARGGTVLLSSHLLAEVAATVDRLVVISGGRIVADDSLDTLLAGNGTTVRALDLRALADALRAAGFTVSPTKDAALRVKASAEQVGRLALATGLVLTGLSDSDGGLEDLYFRLTSTQEVAA